MKNNPEPQAQHKQEFVIPYGLSWWFIVFTLYVRIFNLSYKFKVLVT